MTAPALDAWTAGRFPTVSTTKQDVSPSDALSGGDPAGNVGGM